MLNGVDPVILFNFRKLVPGVLDVANKIPVVTGASAQSFPLPIVPIYLSERLTGIVIDSESKNIDIDTTPETTTTGSDPSVYQKGLNSTIKVEMRASRNSIGVALFAAMADMIFPRVTSTEYSITYLHGAVTVFNGLLHSFSISQNTENDLYNMTLEISKIGTAGKVSVPVVGKITGVVPL